MDINWNAAVVAVSVFGAAAFAVKAVVDGLVRYFIARREMDVLAHNPALEDRVGHLSAVVDALARSLERTNAERDSARVSRLRPPRAASFDDNLRVPTPL